MTTEATVEAPVKEVSEAEVMERINRANAKVGLVIKKRTGDPYGNGMYYMWGKLSRATIENTLELEAYAREVGVITENEVFKP
ncbi:MAG: hypothetical protein WCC04_10750 [Terriglobales bacterium]